ncbi:DUF5677 domain-containing protein [Polaribacter sp. PL03]|uniref:DUF5677 domain-containing protein n=1 Tax=Polaribacter sp. PL03 TaxID=3088353 RepID=UPI0029CFD0A2|nr:DUF5677 domain-containing protein [Polaribacter sp. PL03]MDX6746370.1 DUF5677 domain-containing protein [Polaribacter sp. PL03]
MNTEDYKDLDILINFYSEIHKSIEGKHLNGPNGIEYSESIARKTFLHICSAYSLTQGTNIQLKNNSEIKIVDSSSVAILVRASIESYLTFNHIFISSTTESESKYRFDCWDLAGFIERQDFQATEERSILRKKEEAKIIEEKLILIRKSPHFIETPPKQKKQIEKGNWKINFKWNRLAVNAGFEENYFKDFYSYLCSYAHTGRLSSLQTMQATEYKQQKDNAENFLIHSLIILAKYIYDYVHLIPELKQTFEKNILGKNTVLKWKEIGEQLKKQ